MSKKLANGRMNIEKFKKLKKTIELLPNKSTDNAIASATGWSGVTVNRVRHAKDYAEYVKNHRTENRIDLSKGNSTLFDKPESKIPNSDPPKKVEEPTNKEVIEALGIVKRDIMLYIDLKFTILEKKRKGFFNRG